MRKYFSCFLVVLLLAIASNVYAEGSFSATSSSKQVEQNGTFNVILSGNSVGRVNINVENGSCSTSSLWYEEKTQSILCNAGSSGTVKVTVMPQRGFSDSEGNLYSPGSKVLSVEVKEKTTTKTTEKVEVKTTTTKKNTTTVNSTKTTKKETTNTTKTDVVTTKEKTTEDKKDNNDMILDNNYESLQLSKSEIDSSLENTGMIISEIKIGNSIYPALKAKDNNLLKSDDGNYYIYDSNTEKFTNKVMLIHLNNRDFFVDNDIENATSVLAGDKTIMGEKLADRYYKIKVLNSEGEFIYYIYETTEESMQLFSEDLFACKNVDVNSKNNSMYLIVFGFVLFIIGLLTFVYIKFWRK